MARFNYRKFYFEQVGKTYDSSYAIHHINFNRDDNRIDNLVALPRRLHSKYHFYKQLKGDTQHEIDLVCDSYDIVFAESQAEKIIKTYQDFYATLRECAEWVDERDRLLAENQRKVSEWQHSGFKRIRTTQ